jgi:hypothetical protein
MLRVNLSLSPKIYCFFVLLRIRWSASRRMMSKVVSRGHEAVFGDF